MAAAPQAAAVSVSPGTLGGFEQEGNYVVDTVGNLDWTNVTPVVVTDDLVDSAFQGSSKEEDPANWICQAKAGGVTPGKDNLLRAYANVRQAADAIYLDLGLIRAVGEGDTNVAFEFNKLGEPQDPGDYADGPCGITRSVGDFLVSFSFGGTSDVTSDIRIFTWDGDSWVEQTTGFTAAAANNATALADDPLVAGVQPVPARTFAEVTIKLTEESGFLACPGFAVVNVRSRSAHSITSALQDKMPTTAFDLSRCGEAVLHKVDDLGEPLAGAVFGLFATSDATGTPTYTCTTGADGNCVFEDVDPGDYWAREVSAPATHHPDPDIVPVTVEFGERAEISVPFVDPLKLGSARIVKTEDATGGPVAGIRFFLTQNGQPATMRNGAPAECITATDGTCTIEDLAPGTYAVVEDASTLPPSMNKAPDVTITVVAGQTAVAGFVNPVKPLTISLTKKVNDLDEVTVHEGDDLTYSLVVANRSELPLTITRLVDVANGLPVTLSAQCAGLIGTVLAAGGITSCTYPAVAGADDVTNQATVIGRDEFGRTARADDTAAVKVIHPEIGLVKTVNDQEELTAHPGDPLTYLVTFTNTGDTPLTVTSFIDIANGTAVTLPGTCTALVSTVLDPGESASCSYPGTAPSGGVTNTATVQAVDVIGGDKGEVSASDTAVVTVIDPLISLEKTVNGAPSATAHEGDDLLYRLTVTNTGDTALTITSLTDIANGVPVTLSQECTDLVGDTLAPGASVSCGYEDTAGASRVDNTARVEGVDDLDKEVVAQDTATVVVVHPAIRIDKVVNGAEAITAHAGDPLTYTLTITNTGDVELVLTSLTDVANLTAVALPAECTGLVSTTPLAPGGTRSCTYTATAGDDDVDNVATVVGKDPIPGPKGTVTDDDPARVDVINPAVSIVKTVNDGDTVQVHEGDPLTYKLVITNTGDTPLTLTAVTDVANGTAVALPAGCTDLVGRVLEVGSSVTCTYITTATANDVDNLASVTGEDELDKPVTDDDPARVDVVHPAITIVKTGTPTTISGSSGEVTFTYLVTNTGDIALHDIAVTDDIIGAIGTIASLDPGQSMTLRTTATVQSSARRNVATATGTDTLGKAVTADDDHVTDFVLGDVAIERQLAAVAPPPAQPAQPAPPPATPAPLPRTGRELVPQVVLALGLIAVGSLALIPHRRRRRSI